jgi:hypothetical protein
MMQPILSSAGIKREILANSEITGIRKKISNELSETQYDQYMEIGEALENLVQMKGWVFIEAYMMKFVMSQILSQDTNPLTPGFINLMHYVDQMIQVKNDVKAKKEEKNATT